jgi:Tol biopolymer transport system component
MAQPFDATKLTLSGEPEPLAEHVRVNVGASLAVFSSSQEGTLAYQTRGADERQARLVWRDLSGLERGALGEPGPYFHPRISPDGRQVAVAMLDTAVGTTDLWICDVARGLRHRFASDPAMDTGPVWSPDGQTIAFYSRRGGEGAVWAAPATEITQPRRLWGNSENSTAWSPDGRQILVNSPATVAQEVLTIDSAGGEPRWEIYVTTFGGPGRRWQVSAGGGTEPVWRRDGRGLFYRDDARLHAAEVSGSASEFVVGAIRPLFALPSIFPGGRQWDVSRDGQRILVTEPLAQAAPSAIILTVGWDANLQKP